MATTKKAAAAKPKRRKAPAAAQPAENATTAQETTKAAPKKAKAGRPAGPKKLNAGVIARIVQEIENGHTFENAMRLAAVAIPTGYYWQKIGREQMELREKGERRGELSLHELFVEMKDQAEALFEDAHLQNIRTKATGALGDWKASAWMLERKFPDRYGKRVQLAGDKDQPLQVEQKAQIVLYLPDNGRDPKPE